MSDWRDRWRTALDVAASCVGSLRKLELAAGLPRSTLISSRTVRQKPPTIDVVIAVSRATRGMVRIADVFPHVVEAVEQELGRAPADRAA